MNDSSLAQLLRALDDDSNEALFPFTTAKMRELTKTVLSELMLSKAETNALYAQLKHYKYIDEMNELKYGSFIRWIPIEDPTHLHLVKGAFFCEMNITQEGVFCVCKTFGFPPRYFQIAMDKNLIFQKLTSQERVLLSVLDHLG